MSGHFYWSAIELWEEVQVHSFLQSASRVPCDLQVVPHMCLGFPSFFSSIFFCFVCFLFCLFVCLFVCLYGLCFQRFEPFRGDKNHLPASLEPSCSVPEEVATNLRLVIPCIYTSNDDHDEPHQCEPQHI